MDPLSVVFVPGGLAAAAFLLGAPIAAAGYAAWRWRALRRVARGACGRCGSAFAADGARFLFTGVTICEPCAQALRRRLRVALPTVAAGAALFAVTSGTAFVASLAAGGPDLGWWLDGRWIPLLLPSVGVAGATATVVALGKRANRLAAGRAADRLDAAPAVGALPRGG